MEIKSNVKLKNILKQIDINLPDDKTWKRHKRLWGDWMHRICSYVAMFSPALVEYFIEKYAPEENDIILDTFSGRGTTLLQSRAMNKQAYSLDLNPFSYVISKSKTKSFNQNNIIKRIDLWEKKYLEFKNNWDNLDEVEPKLKIYYSDINLSQMLFIKKTFGEKYQTLSDEDNFILAITLGIMHGPMRKKGDSIYLSLSMSNHTSMSPNYVKKYALKNNLKKPEDNIFQKIKNRAISILKKSNYYEKNAEVKLGNALEINKHFNITPKLVFTSPPYLNIINYTQQNWLKMWMLGFDTKEKNKKINLDDNHKIDNYKKFISNYLNNVSSICDENSSIILVIGDIVKNNELKYSFENIWKEIKEEINLNLIEIYEDRINQNHKATNSMGSRSGKATRVDKIYVFNK